jgi:hypothetical protein
MGFPSKVRHAVDSEPSVILRKLSDGAETATAAEASVSLNALDTAYWHNGEIPFQAVSVVVQVSEIDKSTDETYSLAIQVDSDAAFGGADATTIATFSPTGVGVFVINLDGPTIKALRNDAKFIRIALTAGGTTPSITYAAWLAPSVSNAG